MNDEQRTADADPAHRSSFIAHRFDSWVAISVATDAQFATLATMMGHPALAEDERFATLPARRRNHDELDGAIAAWTRGLGAFEVERRLQAAGVEAAAVATPRDVWADPQLWHRGFFQAVPAPPTAPEIGRRPHLRPAWRMSVTAAETRRRAPEFGEHTDEVLREYLNASDGEIAALEAAGVIARTPALGILARPGPMDLETLVRSRRLLEVDTEYRERLEARLARET